MKETRTNLSNEGTEAAPDDGGSASARIAQRVHQLRTAQGLSLEALAARSGVSRSMISLIERNEASPTAVVLEKLATGLNVVLASLFAAERANSDGDAADDAPVVLRRAGQVSWSDPNSGYLRRNLSPASATAAGGIVPSPIQIVEVTFPPQARVAYETGARDVAIHQQVWMLAGTMQIAVGDEQYRLDAGDCLALVLDRPMAFHNPTEQTARYAVVIATLPAPER